MFFFYEPAYFLAHPIEILYTRQGGLASHGAAIGILIALSILSRKYKLSYLYVLDRVVVTVALSGFFIRLGNLFNSEIYGTESSLPWAFAFVRDPEYWANFTTGGILQGVHPTQLYEAFSYLLIFGVLLLYYYKQQGKTNNGIMFSVFLISVFGMRFLIEFMKVPQESWEVGMFLNMGQLLSIPFILTGIALWIYAKRSKI